ncbi:uncharacterized protein LOC126996327 [Eriocheir sinensis]|uniref:uncharacterized protein LOC126996327 n=1 Tax=Eriocheir sinensis TaxID=95602 RepID=UPI0021C956EB|nr:uncharacterized protein LOC126996327 [Eriocheir sinensis]
MRGAVTCLLVVLIVVLSGGTGGVEAAPSTPYYTLDTQGDAPRLLLPLSLLLREDAQDLLSDPQPPPVAPQPDKRAGRRFRTGSSRDVEEYQVCRPSRREVVALLLALHEVRQGRNPDAMVSLCNILAHPASLDTNIRFLG